MFEYAVYLLRGRQYWKGFGGSAMLGGDIDELGAVDWELISIQLMGDDMIGYFKREVDDASLPVE